MREARRDHRAVDAFGAVGFVDAAGFVGAVGFVEAAGLSGSTGDAGVTASWAPVVTVALLPSSTAPVSQNRPKRT
ncbi:hypothetical protein [Pseudofrankia asymbiotica]|uniref:Uncharacterized protein n=1 Tax=Pseudofrankia asymbiotica TaxID=1834516 RepID=A0A1V2IMI6_9ACTN|nr:hypothetical protein [Pseudofrankia asymbiotica]ONH33621.1 hypothetical protein BL253_00965 [Pseudofrankia asymbiotica]